MTENHAPMFETVVVALDGAVFPERAIHPAATLAAQGGATLTLVSVATPWESRDREDYLRMASVGLPIPAERKVLAYAPAADGLLAELRERPLSLPCMASHGRGAIGRAMLGDISSRVVRELGRPVLTVGPHDLSGITAYTEVIVLVDGSPESLAIVPAAVGLAEQIAAKVQVLQVVEPDALARVAAAGIPDLDVRESGRVSDVARHLPADVAANWDVLHHHDPSAGVVDYLAGHPAAVVAMSTHARSGLDLLAAGSVANHVVHRSPCPVLLLHPTSDAAA